jgi:hypothetical protein
MTRHLSCTETAKLVRTELKAKFPGAKFSVTSSSYAGGASIRVSWNDGPAGDAVKAAVGHFHGASFDGMTDMKSYHDSQHNGETVSFGADYIFFSRELTDAYKASFRAAWAALTDEERSNTLCKTHAWRAASPWVNSWRATPELEDFGSHAGEVFNALMRNFAAGQSLVMEG